MLLKSYPVAGLCLICLLCCCSSGPGFVPEDELILPLLLLWRLGPAFK